ncbi:hypothetical protein Ocepr_2366 (plasmid) [Oceanithermus profundus DSM 14977]|uniref:Uncharacterized protein n=1 Tax=Oceanithermus profundus (strain DSM 14977 / NBRC 100410 / VKM B-2274 / 506) TaxID=670487 RepID=E4UAN5_OCEP5|nr:hypothetical protein [Oceanithermus profundus]ADR37814.1 hypothetical protein Ocepr_2366 [Oceanithermus profundus DSM 14977]
MARRLPSRSRKKRAKVPQDASPRRLSPITLVILAALVALGAAGYFLLPQETPAAATTIPAPPPVITQDEPSVRVAVSAEEEPENPAESAAVPEEVPLEPATPKNTFSIPITRARIANDPMAYYMQLARAPAKRSEPRPSQPTVPLPKFDAPPEEPWIARWVEEEKVRYVAFVAGKQPGAIVATRDGEIVAFAGPFPGTPEVRITHITPKSLFLAAKGHTVEVKK